MQARPQVGKIPWRRAWRPTPAVLPGDCPGQRGLAGYCPWGRDLHTCVPWEGMHTQPSALAGRRWSFLWRAGKGLEGVPAPLLSPFSVSCCLSPEAAPGHRRRWLSAQCPQRTRGAGGGCILPLSMRGGRCA